MARFAFRAVAHDGTVIAGETEADDRPLAIVALRGRGVTPISLEPIANDAGGAGAPTLGGRRARAAAGTIIGEVAVLVGARLPLDRALALALENIDNRQVSLALEPMLQVVRQGLPLSQAMAAQPAIFSPAAIAMTEAGELNGNLADALAKLSEMLERAAHLRRIVSNAMIYPIALIVIATLVVLMMLLFVVPQFDALFKSSANDLPTASLVVIGASRLLRSYGLMLLIAVALAAVTARQALKTHRVQLLVGRAALAAPMLGDLIRRIETARFARTFGFLVNAGVPVPNALALAQRVIGSAPIADGVAQVAKMVREGSTIVQPLAAIGFLPRLAIGFLRTGEETSQLGVMSLRLADVLDRDIELRIQRLIGIITPLITVVLGGTVGAIIASIMSAILGFNELAVS